MAYKSNMDMENSVNLREKKHWQLVINLLNCQCSLLYGAKANSLLYFWCVPSSAAYNLIAQNNDWSRASLPEVLSDAEEDGRIFQIDGGKSNWYQVILPVITMDIAVFMARYFKWPLNICSVGYTRIFNIH